MLSESFHPILAGCDDQNPRRPAGVALTSLALSIIVYCLDASAERVGAYKTKAMHAVHHARTTRYH